MALQLNPLSTSKGKKFECEMCGKPATLACQHCRVTYYCGKQHQSVDWFGIHEKICQLLGALRTLRPTLGSEEERQRRQLTVQMSQHALIDLCKNEAQKHLVQGHFELAIPGALQSLRFCMEVHGAGRAELVPTYLLLAEANLGLKRFKVAEEFLLYANWSVLKNPQCSNELKSQLYRNFGKLYAAQRRYDEALQQLSLDVYCSSLGSGPEHIDTAGGYYYMADVFLLRGSVEQALAFYDKVVDIWYKFLIKVRSRPNESITDYLSEAHIGEATEMLKNIQAIRQKYLPPHHIASGEVTYAIGLLRLLTGFDDEARDKFKQAYLIYHANLGPSHESTRAILASLKHLGVDVTRAEMQKLVEEVAAAKQTAPPTLPPDSSQPEDQRPHQAASGEQTEEDNITKDDAAAQTGQTAEAAEAAETGPAEEEELADSNTSESATLQDDEIGASSPESLNAAAPIAQTSTAENELCTESSKEVHNDESDAETEQPSAIAAEASISEELAEPTGNIEAEGGDSVGITAAEEAAAENDNVDAVEEVSPQSADLVEDTAEVIAQQSEDIADSQQGNEAGLLADTEDGVDGTESSRNAATNSEEAAAASISNEVDDDRLTNIAAVKLTTDQNSTEEAAMQEVKSTEKSTDREAVSGEN